jgi:hypothetical protein
MAVAPGQLSCDADLERLVDQLRARHRVQTGSARLLRALVARGLAQRDLGTAAALCIELDRPREIEETTAA